MRPALPTVLRAALTTSAVAAALALAGCGGERKFTPEEFAAELTEAGAPLVLGEVITTGEDGTDVHSIEFADAAPSATGSGHEEDHEDEHVHSAGTLLALGDADEARAEFERCETAPVLTCFRAANVVLRFDGLEPSDRARLVVALEGMDNTGG